MSDRYITGKAIDDIGYMRGRGADVENGPADEHGSIDLIGMRKSYLAVAHNDDMNVGSAQRKVNIAPWLIGKLYDVVQTMLPFELADVLFPDAAADEHKNEFVVAPKLERGLQQGIQRM